MMPVDICPVCEAPGCKTNETTGMSKCASCGHERYFPYVSHPPMSPDEDPASNKFEYKVIKIKSLLTEKTLNKFGDKGWRLVTIVPAQNSYIYYFVREVFQTIYLDEGEILEIEDE